MALLLEEAAGNPDHEIWREVDKAIEGLRETMRTSRALREQVAMKAREAFAALVQSGIAAAVWNDVKYDVIADLSNPDSQIRARTAAAFRRLGETLADEPNVQKKLNAWWLTAIERALPSARPAIGRWIADIVKSWDAQEIASKLETEIGTDLQYIRLNGALVGGLVGLALHAAA
jgi:uncharacterized membrane-anchored protein YjiN (DUF445 family)